MAMKAAIAIGFFLFTYPALAQDATFEGLGDLEGGNVQSFAYGVSANGAVVVGQGESADGPEAFRWAADPALGGGEGGNMEGLGDLEGGSFQSSANDVSADGTVVVGIGFSDVFIEAFRWESGTMEGLGYLEGGDFQLSQAVAISSDGTIVVGSSSSENGSEAFRWENGVMESLGDLEGGTFNSLASGVSTDGSVVVGFGSSEGGFEAFRWEDGVMEGLGFLEGDTVSSYAYGVSADGSVIVGQSISEGGAEAFIWTEESGMQSLKEILEDDYGLDLAGWTLVYANDMSDDGTVIVGGGTNPDGNYEAWRAFLPFQVADEAAPDALAGVLGVPVPNPARERSTFSIAVERGQKVAVEVFDATGRRVQTLYNGMLAAGMSEALTLDASALPAGAYVIRATGEDFLNTRRVTVVR